MISEFQGTLRQSVVFTGVGIHSGKPATLTVHPADIDYGRRFRTPNGEVLARVDHVISCDRATVLGFGEAKVQTPEHLLSALAACGIDNAQMELDGPEVPILDGSGLEFFEAFQATGVDLQSKLARVLSPSKPIGVSAEKGQQVLVLPLNGSLFEYVLHYEHPMIGCQQVAFDLLEDDYGSQIAPARTFALWEEVQVLLDRGLAQGGQLSNALVVYQDSYSSPLKVENEPVRHKCLDLIGDFALLDARLSARVLAVKAGHYLHVECAKLVWKEMTNYECP